MVNGWRWGLVCALCAAVQLGAGVWPAVAQQDEGQQERDARRRAMSERVDYWLAAGWSAAGVQSAPQADDAEFLRRASLDLAGTIPRVGEVRRFLADESPDKRARLIDRLLASPAHPTHMANTWRSFMLPPNVDVTQQNNVVGVQRWLRNQFADNMRYDRMVGDLLVATGGGDTGPALFYTALEVKPDKLAAATSRIFLGLQIDCAQCHDHPFDRWTQEDFWGYAAFFAQLRQPDAPNAGNVTLEDLQQGEVTLPESDTIVAPTYPGGDPVSPNARGTRRQQLTIWLASRDNPYLARAAVNRVWALLFGRGLVEPVDDLGPHNPPSHPELMVELSEYLVDIGFDLRELLRTLANTRAYQLSSRWTEEDPPAEHLFARMPIKTLTAEQLYDSLSRLLLVPPATMAAGPQQQSSSRLLDPRRQEFIARVQTPSRTATEYEAGVPQALTLMNGVEMNAATSGPESGLLTALHSPLFDDEQRVETLFLATLSRLPRDEERSKFVEYVAGGGATGDRRRALGDCLWALLNSAEFALNH